MSNKYGFKSSEHQVNYVSKVTTNKNKKQPVKILTGDELKAFAEARGVSVSANHKPPQPKVSTPKEVTIEVNNLPEALRRLV